MPFLAATLTFLVVVGILLTIFLPRAAPPDEQIRIRLKRIDKARQRAESSDMGLFVDDRLSDVPWLHSLLTHWSFIATFRKYIAQSGVKIKPGKLLLVCATAGLGAGFAVQLFFPNWLLAGAIGLAAGFVPIVFVAIKRKSRLGQFEKTFPEAIDLLGRSVRAGHAFTSGLEMIAKELPEPVSTEFQTVFDEQNFGVPLRDALLGLTKRVPLLDVQFFVVALIIQKETGGNLAEILDNLSQVIRERFKIYGEVKTKTAHGRMTAGILMALPPGIMGLMEFLSPDYIGLLFTDVWGHYMLGVAATMQIVGCLMLWKLVQTKV
jgi:tight adherence protein B